MKMTVDIVPESFQKYVGLRFYIDDQFARAEHMAFTFANECLGRSDTPFGQMSRNGLLLCEETRSFLYEGDFGKIQSAYPTGTYLVLERYIDSILKPGMTQGEKVIALSQSMHFHLVEKYPKVPAFLYGESDQETLLKGGGHCSCRARLLCALCQMVGISARPVIQWAWRDKAGPTPDRLLGGHTVAEVLIDGNWGFFDPQHHLYCMNGSGRFFSVDEIRSNPECFTRMPDSVTGPMAPVGYGSDQGQSSVFEYYWYKNFRPGCPIQISRHDVNAPYLGGWFWATAEVREKQQRDTARHLKVLNGLAQKGQITDAVYQMGLDEFRSAFGICDGELQSQATVDFMGRPRLALV